VRGITLSDLGPCAAGQGPQFDGTSWVCATNRGPGPAGFPYLIVQDATGVEVGPVFAIGLDLSTAILEHPDGRLFPVAVTPDQIFAPNQGMVYFSGIDCTGTAYLDAAGGAPSLFEIRRTVIARPGTTVYTASGPTLKAWRGDLSTRPAGSVSTRTERLIKALKQKSSHDGLVSSHRFRFVENSRRLPPAGGRR